MMGEKEKRQALPLWLSLLIYVLLSVLMTWPLVRELDTHVPSPDSDVFNVYWGNWWTRHALGNGLNPYETQHLVYPEGFNLVSFAFSPFLALLWIPLSWVLPPLAAYNLVLLATVVLCCVAMDQLVRYLTGNPWAALVAGLTFGFAPCLAAERGCHLNFSALFWIPWVMLLLTRLMREAKSRDAVPLAVTVGLAFLTRLQVGVLVVLFAGVYFIGLALVERKRWRERAFHRLGLAALVACLLLSPLLVFVWQSLQQPGGESLLRGGADQLQTDLLAYVLPPQRHTLFGSWTAEIYERLAVNEQYWAYLGFVPLGLVLFAAVSRPRKTLPWLLTGLFFFMLALGPSLRFNGQVYPPIKLPYSLASDLFSTIGFNWPNRFNLAVMAAVAVLVGLACAQLFARSRRTWLLGIVGLLILAEYVIVPLPTIFAPPDADFYEQIAADDEEYAIVDLPLTRHDGEIHRYYQTIHHKPIVGGWDHRVPDSAFAFIDSNPLLASWRGTDPPGATLETALAELAKANVRYFVVHKHQIDAVPESMRYLLGTLDPVFQDRNILVLPVESETGEGYNIVRWFGADWGLVHPTVFLHPTWDGRPPLLSLYTCWFHSSQHSDDGNQVMLTAPDGSTVYNGTASLPDAAPGLACEFWSPEPAVPLQDGKYNLSITALSGEQSLGTYTTELPTHLLQTREGDPFPAMGFSSPVTFDAPMELLAYNLVGGEGFVWLDLFWRSTAKHQKTYELLAQLVDPETKQIMTSTGYTMEKSKWRKGDLFQERMIFWFDDVPPGEYSLGVSLDGVSPLDEHSGELLPGTIALLDTPLVAVPTPKEALSATEEKGVVVHLY